MLINSACSNTGINSDVKIARNTEDTDSREEFGALSAEDREALTTRRDQLIRIHEDNLRIEEERQDNIRQDIEEIQQLLNRNEDLEEVEPTPSIETETQVEDQDEVSGRRELEALDESALEERLQALVVEVDQVKASLDSSQDCQEILNCRGLLQEIKLVNDVLAEKRNEGFSDNFADLSEEELIQVKASLEEEIETIELEKNRAKNAIETLHQDSLNSYQFIRVKLFPNQRGFGNFPDVKGEDSKYAKLHNKWGFKVQEVDISSNQVLRQLGQAHSVEMFSNCPERPNCSDNRVILDGNEAAILKSSSTITVTPLNGISSEGDSYFNSGFTKVEYRGLKRNCEVYCNIPYVGFYRGSFQVRFARKGKTSSDNHWSVINVVSLDEYLLSVTPSELGTNGTDEIEARKAQIVAARTYALNRALAARTRTRNPRFWDVLPTILSQLYMGAEKERADYYQTIVDTSGQILIREDRPALAEFFSCSDPRTISVADVVEQEMRSVPSGSCRGVQNLLKPLPGENVLAYGHGRGFCQRCGKRLAKYGWSPTDTRRPTQGAAIPLDPSKPWTAEEILHYFYNDIRIGPVLSLPRLSERSTSI